MGVRRRPSITMDSAQRLISLLDALIDAWCDRRALAPLRPLLPAYPPAPVHTDQWVALFEAIRAVRGLAPGTLTETEAAHVAEAHALVWSALKPTEFGRAWLARGAVAEPGP